MSAILLLLRSRLLRPVFIALGVALVIEVGLALALTRATIVQLVETLDTHLGEDVRVIAAELERAGQEVRAGLASLSQRTEERLAAGLSVRLEEEQVRLREVLVAGLRRSADDQASLLAAVAPKAIWDNDVPALTELARMAQRNPDVLFAIYINASGERLTRHLNRQDKRVQALLARGQGKGALDKVLAAAQADASVYIAQAPISPLGSEIGKVLLAVSTEKVDRDLAALDKRFVELIAGSGQLVSDGLSGAAADSSAVLGARLRAAEEATLGMQAGSRAVVQAAATDLRRNIGVGLALVGVALLLLLALVLGRRVLSRLRLLVIALDDLAAGEGDLTRRIELAGRDEIVDMAAAVNRFVAKLQPIVRDAGDVAQQVGQEIAGLAQRSVAAEAAAGRQRDEVAASLQALAHMADEAHAESQAMQHALQRVQAIREAAHENGAIAGKVGHLIEELVVSVEVGAAVIERLARQSEQIEVVLTVIHGIAEQTNLLALNAAIEAARAGESGRGFAVVADEVRALASKTQQSTGDIQAHIGALQSGAREAVGAVGLAGRQATEGLAALRDSSRLQQSVQALVDGVHEAINCATLAAEHQAQGAASVRGRVENILQEAQRAEQAVAATAASGRALDGLAAQLRGSLGQFRV